MLPRFLKKSYPTDKNTYFTPRFALKAVGFYPDQGKSTLVKAWCFFNYFVLVYGSYAEFIYGFGLLSINVIKALDALCPVASSFMSIVKLGIIWWHRNKFEVLIKRISGLTAEQKSEEKMSFKRSYFAIATRITFTAMSFGLGTSTSYTIRAIVSNCLNYFRGEEIQYETPFKMIFPQPLLSMPLFPITFTLSHWHGYVTVAGAVSADGLFLCSCMYFLTLLKALQFDVKHLLGKLDHQTPINRSAELVMEQKLSKIIERHAEVCDLVEQFSSVMSSIVLVHFLTSTFIIGTSVVDMLLFPGYGIFVYIVHTMSVVIQLFLYCLGGTLVIESSNELANAAYGSNWYAYNLRIQKMVLLIIARSQRTLVIKVPFFAPSMPLFNSILSSTGSLIALLKSVI